MKRSTLIGSLAILSGFSACGKSGDGGDGGICSPHTLTKAAQACPDKLSLGFGLENRSAEYIGSKPQQSLDIRNGGLADLTVTQATLTGDSAFTLNTNPVTLPAAIKGNDSFLMQVIFAPTEAKLYTGQITVVSNAENNPTLTLQLSGCGVPADGGTSPCYKDGGR